MSQLYQTGNQSFLLLKLVAEGNYHLQRESLRAPVSNVRRLQAKMSTIPGKGFHVNPAHSILDNPSESEPSSIYWNFRTWFYGGSDESSSRIGG